MSKSKEEKPNTMEMILAPKNDSLPAHMRDEQDTGTELLSQYIVPPRLKIVQALTMAPYNIGDPGTVIVVPMCEVLAEMADKEMGNVFTFVPVFFYPEWCLWNPLELRGQQPAIRQRSLDPTSELAAKAQNRELRMAPCPDLPTKMMRYVEHLNFVIYITSESPCPGTPVIMSFARAEHNTGSTLSGMIRMRRAPLYGCQFVVNSKLKNNNKGRWYGFDPRNPSDDDGVERFVTSSEAYAFLKSQYVEHKSAYEAGLLRADYEDDTETGDEIPPIVDDGTPSF